MSTTDILDLVKKVKSEMPAGAFSPVEGKSLVYDQQQGGETADPSLLTPEARDVLRLVGKIKQGSVAVKPKAAESSVDSQLSPKYDGREADRIADEAAAAKGKENIAKRSEFTRGLLRGIDQTQALYEGGVAMYNAAMGDQAAADTRFANYREQMRQASENPATVDEFFSTDPKKGAFGSVGNLGTYVAGTMGSLLPTIAESAVAGVAGAAIGGAIVPAPDPTDVVAVPVGFIGGVLGRGAMKKAIAETAERYVARGVAAEAAQQMGERAVKSALAKRIGATIGTSQITALQEGGGMYAEGREAGYDNPWSAILLGQVSGASEGVLGNVPFALRTFIGKTAVREAAQKFGTKEAAGLLWDAVKNAGEEAVQESFQEFLGDVNSRINDPNQKIFTKENFKQWAESGAAGALAGGILGGGGVATQAALDARRRQLEELRAKGFISKEEAKDNGIEGSTRREIMGNAEQELADLNDVDALAKQESDRNFATQQQQAQAPQPQAGVQPEQFAEVPIPEDGGMTDEEYAAFRQAQMGAQGGNVSTQPPTSTPTVPPVAPQPTVQPPQIQPQQPAAVQPPIPQPQVPPAAPAVEPPQAPPFAQQPQPLYEVAGDENMVARVWPNPKGFLVNVADMDSGEVDTTATIFPTFEQAKQHADTIRLPSQPQAPPPVPASLTDRGFAEQKAAEQGPVAPQVPVITSPEEHASLPMFGVYERTFQGQKRYGVKGSDRGGFGDSLFGSPEAAQAESDRRFASSKDQERKSEESKKKAEEDAKKKADYEASFGGFLSTDPKTKGRQLKVLGKPVQSDGNATTIKDLIEQRVASGYVVNDAGQLESPDKRSVLTANKITKIGMDYARRLIANKAQPPTEKPPAPSISEVFDELKKYPEKVAGMSNEEIKDELEKLKSERAAEQGLVTPKAPVIKQKLKNAIRFAPDTAIPEGVPFVRGKHPAFGDYIEVSTANVNRIPGYSPDLPSQGDRPPKVESEQQKPTERNIPSYRDWRFTSTAKNSGKIVPNRVGVKFSPSQMQSIVKWAESEGYSVSNVTQTGIRVLDPSGNRLDIAMFGIAGVKDEESKAASKRRSEATQKADEERKAKADGRESASWITDTFGGVINDYNRNALSDYLEGVTDKFAGSVSANWKDGLEKLGALSAEGKIDWKKVKDAYSASKPAEQPATEPTDAVTAPTEPPVEQPEQSEGVDAALKALDAMLASEKPKEPPKPRSVRKEPEKTKQGQYVLPLMPGMAAEIDRQDFVRRYRDRALEPLWGWSNKEEDAEGIQATIDTLAPIYSEIFNDIYAGKRETIDDVYDSEPYERILKLDDDALAVGDALIISRLDEQIKAALQDYPKKEAKRPPRKSEQTLKEAKSDMQAAHDAAKALMDKIRGKLMSGVDPEISAEVVRVAYLYTKAGIKTFKGYVEAVVEQFGEAFAREFAPYMEDGWTALNIRKLVSDPTGKVEDYLEKETTDGEQIPSGTTGANQEGNKRGGGDEGAPRRDGVTEALEGTQPEDGGAAKEPGDTGGVRSTRGGSVQQGGVEPDVNVSDVNVGGATDVPGVVADGARDGFSRPGDGPGIDLAPKSTRPNFHLTNPDVIVGRGLKDKFARNVKALELSQELEESGRPPTQEELEVLASYIGWGAFGQELFQGNWKNPRVKKDWESENDWLRSHLGEDEWRSAQESIPNAHYTDPEVVSGIWSMIQKMGFAGGRFLEPSFGVGNFAALMPRDVMDRTSFTAIELDKATARIAKILYPQINVQQKGYQDSKTPNDFYDVVATNVPFGNYKISDRMYRMSYSIHNYFFRKAIDQTKPGGLMVFVTSNMTMDGKEEAKLLRKQLSDRGDLVAAFRFPTGAFERYAKTKVVADLIIIRKRKPGENPSPKNQEWIDIVDAETPSGEKVQVNQYWTKHPENVLGTLDYGHGTTSGRPGMIVDKPADLEDRWSKAIASVPANILNTERAVGEGKERANERKLRQNTVVHKDGELYIAKGEQLLPLKNYVNWYRSGSKEATIKKIRDEMVALLKVRDSLEKVLEVQGRGVDASKEREALNKDYDSFVRSYGPVTTSKAIEYLKASRDAIGNAVASLEKLTASGEYEKRPVFTRTTVRQPPRVGEKLNPVDAFAIARNNSIDIDWDEVARLAQMPKADVLDTLVKEKLIYKTGDGIYDAADVFLSGNMARKIRNLEAAKNEGVQGLDESIKAAKAVLPEPLVYNQIQVGLGAPWITAEDYSQFFADLLSEDPKNTKIFKGARGWKVDFANHVNRLPGVVSHGHPEVPFSRMAAAAMNNGRVSVFYTDEDGNKRKDEQATIDANAKLDALKDTFKDWVWQTPDRIARLSQAYNEDHRSIVTPDWKKINVPLLFEGLALQRGEDPFSLRKHQEVAVYRAIIQGKGLFAHEVGTGKTLTIASIAVESRRLRLANKPMLLAHNANSQAVYREAQEAYPGAKILYVDNLDPSNKNQAMSSIATEDWDLIVVPHSLINNFKMRPETLEKILQEQMDQLEAAALEAFAEDDSPFKGKMPSNLDEVSSEDLKKLKQRTAKELVKERLALREKIKEAQSDAASESTIFIEDMGVDMILVDEAHIFKKIPIATRQQVKGLNKAASEPGRALMLLADYIRGTQNGRGVYLFTGTPVTNTLNEIYNMQRYIMPDEMQAVGVKDWDGWFNTFATSETSDELSAGGTYEEFERLTSFVNLPELRLAIGQYMDTVFGSEMPEFIPRKTREGRVEEGDVVIGRPYKQVHNETLEMMPIQRQMSEDLKRRYTALRQAKGIAKMEMMRSREYNPLLINTEGVKMALDPRLMEGVDPSTIDPRDSRLKINKMIVNAMGHYYSHPKATQMIFMEIGHSDWSDRTVGKDNDGKPIKERVRVYNLAKEIKRRLMEEGVPESEIALFSSMTKEQRFEAARKMNRGEIRFAIGGTETMGTGVNAQENLVAMHHLDAPWMPGALEQRNGRGFRQGNRWNTVHEYRYLTEGPQDGRRWQVLLTKDRFIYRFLHDVGDERIIDMSDVDMDEEGQGDFESTFAAAVGDPRIQQRFKLEREIAKLETAKERHHRTIQDSLWEAHKQSTQDIPRITKDIEDLSAIQKAYQDTRPQKEGDEKTPEPMLTIEVQGFPNSEVYGANAITDALQAIFDRYSASTSLPPPGGFKTKQVATYRGVGVFVYGRELFVGKSYLEIGPSFSSLDGLLRNIGRRIENKTTELEKKEAFVKSANQSAKLPFVRQDQLDFKKKKLKYLVAELAANPQGSPPWFRNMAPMGSSIYVRKRKRAEGRQAFEDMQSEMFREQVTGEPATQDVQYELEEHAVAGYRSDTHVLYEDGTKTVAVEASKVLDEQGNSIYADIEKYRNGTSQSDLDNGLRNPPPLLMQTEPDIYAGFRSQAMNLGLAAEKAGITAFEDFVAHSVDTIGTDETYKLGAYLRRVGEIVGMTGIRPVKDILGVPMTPEEYVQLGKEAFAGSPQVTPEQVEAGIEAAMITGLPQMAAGFAPAGSPVPGQGLMQGDFDQPADYEFTESNYRPAVVSYARDKWGGEVAANGKPTWQNFVRWFGDSAVVDKDGKPLVVYHGGARTIDDNIIRTPFFYMTENRSEAEYWAGEDGRIHEVYLKFTKPYRDSRHDDRFMDMEERAQDYDRDDPEFAERLREVTREAVDRMNELKGQGYNSIVMQGEADEDYDNFIAFDPTQIKSATGNAGTFDPNNPNMLMQQEASGIDADSIPRTVLDKMSRRLKSMGYDSRGAEDVRKAIKEMRLLDFQEDWIAAYQFAVGAEQERRGKAKAKKDLKHVNWSRLSQLGETLNPNEAGYIKPDGSLADFSGKREGGQPGTRSFDHREAGGTAGMQEVIAYGWVRMDENSGSLDIAKMPTPAQLSAITRMAQRKFGEIVLDLEDGLGEWREKDEYYSNPRRRWSQQYPEGTKPQRIINDIKKFFGGDTPNTLYQQDDAAYLDAVERGDMKTAQKMVDEAARSAGYNVGPVFHGTPTGGFTEFDRQLIGSKGGHGRGGFSFTTNKDVAYRYANAFSKTTVALDKAIAIANKAFSKIFEKQGEANTIVNKFFSAENEDPIELYWGVIEDNEELAGELRDIANRIEKVGDENAENLRKAASILESAEGGEPEVKGVFLRVPEGSTSLTATPQTLGAVAKDLDVSQLPTRAAKVDVGNGEVVYYVADPSQIKTADPVAYDDKGDVIPLSQRFDDTRSDIRFQRQSQGGNVKGWTKFISGTRALIGATNKADISTVIHEYAHVIRRFLLDRDVPQDQRIDITDEEISMLEEKCGVKDGNWDVPAEEKFAKMWEQYFFEGKSPNTLLDSLFAKISRWMRQVYQSAMSITGGTLDPEVSKLFDKMVQRQLPADQRTDAKSRDGGKDKPPIYLPVTSDQWGDNLTSLANAAANDTREKLKLPSLTEPASEGFQEWLDAAVVIMRNDPTYANRLVKELQQSSRSIDDIDVAVLNLHYRHLKNLSDAAAKRLFKAIDDKLGDVAVVEARRESDALINEIEDFTDMTKKVGTEAGRALVARKIALAEDYTLGNLLLKARVANAGQPLSESQLQEVRELADKIAKLEGDLAKEIQEKDDLARKLAAKESIDDTQKQVGKPVRNTATNRAVKKVENFVNKFVNIFGKRDDTTTLQQTEDEQMAEDGEEVIKSFVEAGVYSFGEFMSKFKAVIKGDVPVAARAALRKAWEKLKAQGDIPAPEMSDERQTAELRRLAKMVERNLVEFGITDPEEVIDGVHEALQEVFEDVTRREAMDAMSGYGQYSTPSQEPNDKIIRDLNAQFQQMGKLDDMKQGIAPKKSGRGRDEPSPELRELIREVNEMKRNSKYHITDPEAQLKTIFQATRTALRNRIYDLDKAIKTKEPIPGRTPNTFEDEQAKEIESLRKRRDELMADYKATFPKPGLTFEQRAAIAERAVDREITKIEQQLASGNVAAKERAEPVSTPALKDKQNRLESLRAQREAVREMQMTETDKKEKADRLERQAEKAYVANLLNRIADYEDRKAQGYFGPKEKKKPRDLSPREIELSRQLVNLKDEFFRYAAEYRLKNMSKVERFWDRTKETMHLSRAIMTSFDLSAVFRQGGIASLAHPRLAAAASREMLAALRRGDAEFDTMDKISKDELYTLAMRAGLSITTDSGKITRQEEAYMGRWAKWGIGKKGTKINTASQVVLKPITASARAYTTFLNSMRFRVFKYMVSNLSAGGEVTIDEAKVIASYVNAATGRAELGKFNQAAANLNTVFFAPRYVASRFQYLAMPFYLLPSTKVSGRVKKMIAMEYARHAMGLTAFLGLSVALASLLTDDEEEKPTVEFDPRSSDFMKLKIGDTRIDPMAGLSQTVTLIGQMATGQKKGLRGDIKDLYGENRKFGDPDLWDVGTGFLRKKLAPIPGAIVDLRVGENVIGEKETVLSATTDLFVPLSFQEAGETMKARGLVGGAVVTALSLLGMGGGTYGPKTQYATADTAKREELFKKDLENVKWNDPDLAYKDFLTTAQLDRFNKQREGRKQSLVFSAAADPKRKDYNSDETFKKSVEERDKALDAVIKAGMGPKETQLLLIAYYKRNYGSAYEVRGGVYQMKESLANRLRTIRRKLNEKKTTAK